MDFAYDVEPARPEPAPAPERPVLAAPSAPVPLAVATLTVGHAEDGAERDADVRAATALDRLRRRGPGDPLASGGQAQVRRSPAPSGGAPEVGRAGGELGAGTSAEIAGRRGAGRRLEEPVLRRMQTAFGADFSGVRIHDDAASAVLNARVSARAFTTGKDIFFGAGQYAPDSPAGEQTLAHELAHTLQPAAPVRRELTEGDRKSMEGSVAAAKDGLGLGPAPAPVQARGAVAPTTLGELRALSDAQVLELAASDDYSVGGPLMTVLKGALEADWFKAKECLVFDKWPGGPAAFAHDSGLQLMFGLIRLRTQVHEVVKAKVGPKLKSRILDEALTARAQEAALATGADTLEKRKGLGDKRARLLHRITRLERDAVAAEATLISFGKAGGANSVTSDVDISTSGSYTEWGVAVYNQLFRSHVGVSFDAGTVFDLNVYAKDWIFFDSKREVTTAASTTVVDGREVTTAASTTIVPGTEDPAAEAALTPEDKRAIDHDQQVWALAHVARFLDEDAWKRHTEIALGKIDDDARRDLERERFVEAWTRAAAFRRTLEATMAQLSTAVDPGPGSAWADADQRHHAEGAVLMRAANQLYETSLLRLRKMREQIADLRSRELDEREAKILLGLLRELPRQVSQASLYANEVYGSGGATVHAVIGMQHRKARATALGHAVSVDLSPAAWYQTFDDNLGDVMKDFTHFAVPHGTHVPDYWWAAFKMGKYLDRMLDAVPHLADGPAPLISRPAAQGVEASPGFVALRELADQHVQKKAGVAETDPKKLSEDAFFGSFGRPQVEAVRDQALALWSTVRGLVSNGPPAAATGSPGTAASSRNGTAPAPLVALAALDTGALTQVVSAL